MHVSSAASQAGIVPRWHIDANALAVLETFFGVEMFPNVEARKQLGQDLQVSPRQIQVWFQNRRQRERKRKEKGARNGGVVSPSPLSRGMSSGSSLSTINISQSHLSQASLQNLSSESLGIADSEDGGSSTLLELGDVPDADAVPNISVPYRRTLPLAPVPREPPTHKSGAAAGGAGGGAARVASALDDEYSKPTSPLPNNILGAGGDATAPLSDTAAAPRPRMPPAIDSPLRSAPPAASSFTPPSLGKTPRAHSQDGPNKRQCAGLGGGAPPAAPNKSSALPDPGSAGEYDWLGAMRSLLPQPPAGLNPGSAAGGLGGTGLGGGLSGLLPPGGLAGPAGSLPPPSLSANGLSAALLSSALNQVNNPQPPPPLHGLPPSSPSKPPPSNTTPADGLPNVAARLAAACQSALLGRTLQQFGGIVQVITESSQPYRVLSISPGWQRLCGYSRDEVLGKPLNFMQGPRTEPDAIRALMRAVNAEMPVSVRLTNYTRSGVPFVHQLSCEPLRDPSGATKCFQATSLVLQAPGEAQSDSDVQAAVGSMPPICTNTVPPLWPLLGRAVSSGDLRQQQQREQQKQQPPAPPASRKASASSENPASRLNSDSVSDVQQVDGMDDDKFDEDFFSWLEGGGGVDEVTSNFMSSIDGDGGVAEI